MKCHSIDVPPTSDVQTPVTEHPQQPPGTFLASAPTSLCAELSQTSASSGHSPAHHVLIETALCGLLYRLLASCCPARSRARRLQQALLCRSEEKTWPVVLLLPVEARGQHHLCLEPHHPNPSKELCRTEMLAPDRQGSSPTSHGSSQLSSNPFPASLSFPGNNLEPERNGLPSTTQAVLLLGSV